MKKNELKNEWIKYGLNKIIKKFINMLKSVLHLKGIIEDLSGYVTNLVLIIIAVFEQT